MKKTHNTVDLLSNPKTSIDLWDEINKEAVNPNTVLFNFGYGDTHRVRFLGPFIKVERVYSLISHQYHFIAEQINMHAIINGDLNELSKAREVVDKIYKERLYHCTDKDYKSICTYLSKFPKNIPWQKCIAVNALFTVTNQIKIVLLTRKLCDSIFEKTTSDAKINGLFAHDFIIRKIDGRYPQSDPPPQQPPAPQSLNRLPNVRSSWSVGYPAVVYAQPQLNSPVYSIGMQVERNSQQGFPQPFFNVELTAPAHLTDLQSAFVLNHGLFDIPYAIDMVNRREGAYYYKLIEKGYMMPEEFNKAILEELEKKQSNQHIDAAEEYINDLPADAFEKPKINSSIADLDLD